MNETEMVFSHVLKCDRAALYLDRNRRLSAHEGRSMAQILKRRCRGESLFYILGAAEFMGFPLRVTPDCLVPRPETEILVEKAVSYASAHDGCRILDIGTGSGCIAVSLARLIAPARITAVDISGAALTVARDNACRAGVASRIDFICADLFPPDPCGRFDLIVSNPPYVRSDDIDGLSPEVRSEPRIALDGGPDGLAFYRRIIAAAHRHLKPAGALIMEIGSGQSEAVGRMFDASKKYTVKEIIVDYNGIERIMTATRD